MAIDKKIIDELLKNYQSPDDIIGEKGILKQLTKSLL
jgi:putative transposase